LASLSKPTNVTFVGKARSLP